MNKGSYKYDVAFSFLAKDEELAVKLNNLIINRLNTFIYSERQDVLAGCDGEEKFNQVFSSDSRIVVVLYREGWGNTPFTRIEKTAIKNRAFNEGYDFTLFIPLDTKPSVPRWLPRTQLWFGIERWGIKGTASVIEAKVQQFGGTVHEETALDKAARLAEEMEIEDNRKRFLNSREGVILAKKEIEILFGKLKNMAKEISSQSNQTLCKIIPLTDHLVIHLKGISLELGWHNRFTNTLDEAVLIVILLEGFPRLQGYLGTQEPLVLKKKEFQFDINRLGKNGWVEKRYNTEITVTDQFTENLMKDFLDRVSKKMQHDINVGRTS